MTRFDTWDSYFLDDARDLRIPEKSRVLRNLLQIGDAATLAHEERAITLARVAELERSPIHGAFDFEHHCAIHAYIFGDVYEWAGHPRAVDMGKTHRLWPARDITAQAPLTYGAIADEDFLRGLGHDDFVHRLAEHWGEVNVLHAFREGNTRSQRVFFGQLCEQAGFTLSGDYLEAHFDEFTATREAAMVTANSEKFATFLQPAVIDQTS